MYGEPIASTGLALWNILHRTTLLSDGRFPKHGSP
jgi:hypothetical protein